MSDTVGKISKVLDEVKPVLDKARKPGFATSEFWTTLAVKVAGIVAMFVGVGSNTWWVMLIGGAVAVLGNFGYLATRVGVKKAAVQVVPILTEVAKVIIERMSKARKEKTGS